MSQDLLQTSPHEIQTQTHLSLIHSHSLFTHHIKPPFSLSIPSPSDYLHLNRAILYALLTSPTSHNKTHFTHLNAIVTDGFEFFTNLLQTLITESYPKLLPHAKSQLLWISSKLIDVSAEGVENIFLCLLRQIVGGDFSEGNLFLSMELVRVLWDKWDWVLSKPLLLTSAVFTYLRLLADHYRLPSPKFDQLKRVEIDFCVRVLRECFSFCLRIGRDLVRLLQDLVHIPEIRAIWKDLLSNPSEFRVPEFLDISQLYHSRTSSRYFLLRVTPEMETNLRFLLTHVKWGNQKRYQVWFSKKFLFTPEKETIICDLVRFICCAHHPSNEIIQSSVISRWAVIGWLLKCCRRNHVEANVKLALFYDWLFFDEKIDNIMNIEPAILLMVHSIPKYMDMTHGLLEFLFLLLDNYDVDRKDLIVRGVSASFSVLLKKGVIHSLETLSTCSALAPFLKARLSMFFQNLKQVVASEALAPRVQLNLTNVSDLENVELSNSQKMGLSTCSIENGIQNNVDAAICVSDNTVASSPVISNKCQMGVIENLVRDLGSTFKQSKKTGFNTLETILFTFAALDSQELDASIGGDCVSSPETLACQILDASTLNEDEMFAPLRSLPNELDYDNEIQSATALVIRAFIYSQCKRMEEMILFWSKNGQPVGPRLLSYVSRLACEAHMMDQLRNSSYHKKCINCHPCDGDENTSKDFDFEKSLLKCHIEGYISFTSGSRINNTTNVIISTSTVDIKLVDKLVQGAFIAYRSLLTLSSMNPPLILAVQFNGTSETEDYSNDNSSEGVKEKDRALALSLLSDLKSCCGWKAKRSKCIFQSIFCHLSDLTTANEDFIRLLVDLLDHVDLVAMQFEVGLKRFSVFGEDTEIICQLVKSSFEWNFVVQQKFWALLISELAVSKVQVEKLLLDLCSDLLDMNEHYVAIGALLTLSRCRSPTPELVGAIMSLPNAFGDFAAAVLATWVVSNRSMLFENLVEWLKKLNNMDVRSVSVKPTAIRINYSAITEFLTFLNSEDFRTTDCLSSMAVSIPQIKAKLADIMVVHDGKCAL
ncbi:embryo defective 2739 [Tasmannia lanceolata]|uniref:embryo defective 2739 n=1 Tax=Tasmannia lanceolata TaxID=3420 RepID=UPI004063F6F6